MSLLLGAAPATAADPESGASALRERAGQVFGTLPADVPNAANPSSQAKIDLGRMLYYDKRLSKNHDVSCNSCHVLEAFGVDGEPTSPGHRGQRGNRNSPTVFNAALHLAQFWDGRASDVEEQAKGPVLNPVEMAMPGEEAVLAVLRSIPGYVEAFRAAFPNDAEPLTYENFGKAVGAFERRLLTPGPLDRFLAGDDGALSAEQQAGLEAFLAVGCTSCHMGPAVGGSIYQKLGLVKPFETSDPGRFAVTGKEADRGFFKVPSLRNIEKTGPYFHDGSVASLEEAVRLMARHQLGRELDESELRQLLTFLGSLTGELPAAYIAQPELPPSGPDTPPPDPS